MTTMPVRVLFVQAWDGGVVDYFISPPLGINRVRRWIEEELGEAVDITCFDPNVHADARPRLGELANRESFDIIAFSPLHLTLENDIALMLDVGQACPDALWVVGGQQAAFAYDLLFRHVPHLDVVVVGEGERPMCSIVRRVLEEGAVAVKKNPSILRDIPGLYLRGSDVRLTGFNPALGVEDFVKATFRLDFADLDHAPYWAWIERHYTEEQLRQPKWQKKIYTVKPYTTNYCPMNCSFCSTTQFYRSAGDGRAAVRGVRGPVLEEYLTSILENQPRARTIMFKDDLWFIRGKGGRQALMEDLDALARVRQRFPDRDITYSGKARVDTFVNPKDLTIDTELLARAKDAGFFSLSFGVESFDVDELEYFNKRLGAVGPTVNRLALEATRAAGIGTVGYMILSCPISTVDSIFRSLDAVTELLTLGHTIKVNPWMFTLPGTTTAQQLSERPDLCIEDDFDVPGYPGLAIRRNVKVLPEDSAARDLVSSYADRIHATEAEIREQSGVTHWISEISTPVHLLAFYDAAVGAGMRDASDVEAQRHQLRQVIAAYTGERAQESQQLTFA